MYSCYEAFGLKPRAVTLVKSYTHDLHFVYCNHITTRLEQIVILQKKKVKLTKLYSKKILTVEAFEREADAEFYSL